MLLRSWLIWTAVPFWIFGVLTFTTPDLSPTAKIVYAWVTYALLRVVYTANNVPYASMNAVITTDPDERLSIAVLRQIGANFAGLIIGSLAIPMVVLFSGGKVPEPLLRVLPRTLTAPLLLAVNWCHGMETRGYQLTMGLLLTLSMILFVVAFFASKERIQPNPQQKTSLAQDLADLFQNRPWIVLFLATVFYFGAIAMRGSVMLPYFRYVALNVSYFPWFSGFSLASLILGVACSAWVNAHMDKRHIFIGSMILTAALSAVLLFLPATNPTIFHLRLSSYTLDVPFSRVFLSEILRQFSYGLSGGIIWAMMGDVADYGEWKTGRRASGTVTAAVVFGLWAGLALGGAVAGWIQAGYGYASEAAQQSAHAQTGIVLTASVYTALAFVGAAACFVFYPVSNKQNQKIASELAERRKGFSAGVS